MSGVRLEDLLDGHPWQDLIKPDPPAGFNRRLELIRYPPGPLRDGAPILDGTRFVLEAGCYALGTGGIRVTLDLFRSDFERGALVYSPEVARLDEMIRRGDWISGNNLVLDHWLRRHPSHGVQRASDTPGTMTLRQWAALPNATHHAADGSPLDVAWLANIIV